ncbi:MAG: IPT/TIG domain-containing protein, partial [Actinomycetota bacterium]
EKVTPLPGFGHPWNNNIFGMDVFEGHYYAGTWVWGGGTEVFRAPVLPPHEGVTPAPFAFEQVSPPGLNGDPRNSINISMVHLGDTLYVAGADLSGNSPGYFYRTGGAPTAAEHLTEWTAITGEGFPPPTGGGILPLDGPFWLETFKGKVYVVVEQGGHGADGRGQIWVYEPTNVPVLSVTSVTDCAVAGGEVTIGGTGFDDYQGDAYPTLRGQPISVARWTDTEIVARLPADARSGEVAVYRDGETSNGERVTIRRSGCRTGP